MPLGRVTLIALLVVGLTSPSASADVLLTPFVGANVGGSSSAPIASLAGDASRTSFGASAAIMSGGVLGLEADLGYTPRFFSADVPIAGIPLTLAQNRVITAMANLTAEVLAPHGLTMVLEPLSDNPDLFLRTSDQTYMICRAVDSPACKILFDIYHMQRNEGHLIPHMDWAWSEIAYFQIGDVPGRKEPGTGEINYKNVFRHIHTKAGQAGQDFVLGMEHGNAVPGVEGERALIDAYVRADGF
jgi:sugar phosphate isomerase/epimerase